MSEPFFKIRKFSLSEGELLTADIEEEDYDALNDETFGGGGGNDSGALGDDWEEGHEKYAELATHRRVLRENTHTAFKPFFDEDDEDLDDHLTDLDDPTKAKWHTKEIVVQSLSQLGLEDDLDDSPLTSYQRNADHKPFHPLFGSSAPPALLTAQECGSPKTHSIWSADHIYSSTPTQDERLNSLLKTLQTAPPSQLPDQLNGSVFGGTQVPRPPPSFLPNAHRLEDVERSLLNQPPKPSEISCEWTSPKTIRAEQLEEELLSGVSHAPHTSLSCLGLDSLTSPVSGRGWKPSEPSRTGCWLPSPRPPLASNVHTLDEVEKDILSHAQMPTVEDLECFLQGGSMAGPPPPSHHTHSPAPKLQGVPAPAMLNGPPQQPPIGTPPQGSPLISILNSTTLGSSPGPFGANCGRSSPHIVPPVPSKVLPPHPILNPTRHVSPFSVPPRLPNNIPRMHFMPNHGSPRPNFCNADLERLLYSRHIHHPLLNMQWPPQSPQQGRFPHQHHQHDMGFSRGTNKDEYAGLMNQREKEWLIKIQMLQLHSDNPYVDDYYFTKFNMQKLTQQQKKKSSGEQVKLMIPERIKHETKTYVPVQYAGSLGKLQVISVNFPRKVLDVHSIAGEEENSRNPANKELHKQRKILLDIEKLYSVLLDIDDEEKMMCALPKEAHVPHRENREKLIETLFEGLSCFSDPTPVDDRFLRISCIRKGRHLILRALAFFHRMQQVDVLRCFLHHLGPIMRRDKIEQVIEHYLDETIVPLILDLDVTHLLSLSSAFAHNLSSVKVDQPSKDTGLFVYALHTRVGFTILCTMFSRAEAHFKDGYDVKNDVHSQWCDFAKLLIKGMSHQDDLCLPQVDVETGSLWSHLKKIGIQEDQLNLLRAKWTVHSLSDTNGNSLSPH